MFSLKQFGLGLAFCWLTVPSAAQAGEYAPLTDLALGRVAVIDATDLPTSVHRGRGSGKRLFMVELRTAVNIRRAMLDVGFDISDIVSDCQLQDRFDYSHRMPPTGGVFDEYGDVVFDQDKIPAERDHFSYYALFPIASDDTRTLVYDMTTKPTEVCIELVWESGTGNPKYTSNTVRVSAARLAKALDDHRKKQ